MMANESPASARGFFTPPPKWSSSPAPASQRKPHYPRSAGKQVLFHVIHKVPAGDSPYVRAKHVQLIDKDPSRAVSLFWAAINSGDRVDSALKDMAIVMKQLNRSDEAIEAIKSFRHLSSTESQESIDNILIELYKRSGRIEEEIELLEHKLKNIEEGIAFGGKKTKMARSQGKKVEITLEKEYSRLLGNLAWAHMQLKNFKLAEENYRKALSLEPDRNKQCNLAICLMHMNKIAEAKFLLQSIRASSDYREMDDSCHKSLECATEMLAELESQNTVKHMAQGEICKGARTSSTLDAQTDKMLQCESDSKGTEGYSVQPSTADKVKKESVSCWRKYGSHFTGEHLESSFQYKKTQASPFSAGETPMVPFTQPRRCAWSFNNGHQEKGWSRTSRKLSFEQHLNNGNVKTVEKQKSDFGHWRSVSWENCNIMKTQSTLPKIHDWKRRRDSMQNDKKCMESLSFTLEASTLDFSSEMKFCDSREQDCQNSEFTTAGGTSLLDTAEHLVGSEKSINQLPANEKRLTSACQRKKSWADMVEEDELDMRRFETPSKCSLGQEDRDEFNDENANCNIIHETPSVKNQAENLSLSVETLDLNDGYHTQPEQTIKRPMCFDHEQSADGTETRSSPLHRQLNFDSVKVVPPEGDFIIQTPLRLKRRNRLQVFKDITPDSPRF